MTENQEQARIQELADRLLSGNRRALAKAITLAENHRPDVRKIANQLISSILPHTGNAVRVGISGVPGVGKSTFIEALGMYLVEQGKKVAVLAVDPSSKISGGSIMGDKVRMERLSREDQAFIRPSPSSGSLGGVARRTRETMLLCEAAGFDVILVETVGVGQSEVTVCEMTDFFLVLLLPGAGDEIQGIKKGIIEMADGLVINKADGDMARSASLAQNHYRNAVHYIRPKTRGWQPSVLCASALQAQGIDTVWEMIMEHRKFLNDHNQLEALREDQTAMWFQAALRSGLLDRLYSNKAVKAEMPEMKRQMAAKKKSAHQCAEEIVELFLNQGRSM